MNEKVKAVPTPIDYVDHLRTRGKMTNQEIAEVIGSNPNSVSNWRRGKTLPHYRFLLRLHLVCELVDILIDEFDYQPEEVFCWFVRKSRVFDNRSPTYALRRLDPNLVLLKAREEHRGICRAETL